MIVIYSIFLLLFDILNIGFSSNWAQTSGILQQNVVIPRFPTPEFPHWEKRYGHAAVAKFAESASDPSFIFILGGDSYDADYSTKYQHLRDTSWTQGYKNDVWSSTGTEWMFLPDIRLWNEYHEKIPRMWSQMIWKSVTTGLIPPPGETYDSWLRCQPVLIDRLPDPSICDDENLKYAVQWSPRRHHAAVYFKNQIWVMGGRARELHEIPEDQTIGGILGPRVADIYRDNVGVGLNFDQKFTNIREVSVYKSDVWKSSDGETWELVSAGCRAPQLNYIAQGNDAEQKLGKAEFICRKNSDCYGAEKCDLTFKTCVCQMWTSREQHAVAAYDKYLYVVGGFVSRLFSRQSNCGAYACGDTNAGSYRYYTQDVWRSEDGSKWTAVSLGTVESFPGRGGHQMIIIPGLSTGEKAKMMIFGGCGGNPESNEVVYFNDVWESPLDIISWKRVKNPRPKWTPRTGHTVTLEPPSAINNNQRILYLVGGRTKEGFSDEVWTLRPDVADDFWRLDYTKQALYRTGNSITNELFNTDSPAAYYITPDSNLTEMIKFWVPTPDNAELSNPGMRRETRQYVSDAQLAMLHSVGLYSIRDLATADKYVILKLRGWDFPQVTERLNFYDICDYRALAIAIVDKCYVNEKTRFYDGENSMPWNNKVVFGGLAPVSLPAEWHDRTYLDMISETDPTVIIENWDGCSPLAGVTLPNVNGLGKVSQVASIRYPRPELQELFCKYNPGSRYYHASLFFDEKLYLFGGLRSDTELLQDSWYRDDRMPSVNFRKKPKQSSPNSIFRFEADEAGCIFEYRVWDLYYFYELRKWTKVGKDTDVFWLNWREGGPGNGVYVLYVRAIDPAGNRDDTFQLGRNVYVWTYVSPTPWDIIFGTIAGFLFLCFLAYLEYRRRVKKAAMERYAMKRMRRKFKAMQRDLDGRAVDWRTLYNEHKENKENEELDNRKQAREMKKKREAAKLAREKDKEKREKEKDKIRKKLRAKGSVAGGGGAGKSVGVKNISDVVSEVASSTVKKGVLPDESYLSKNKKAGNPKEIDNGGGNDVSKEKGKSTELVKSGKDGKDDGLNKRNVTNVTGASKRIKEFDEAPSTKKNV